MILAAAPEDVADVSPLDISALGRIVLDCHDGSARYVVIAARGGDQPLWLTGDDTSHGMAAVLPLDATFDLRLEATARFHRLQRGHPAGPLPHSLGLTPQRRARLIQLLHALDFRLAGASPRDVATALLDAEAAHLPAIEWKSSALRRKVNRLIREALALMNGGYRDLLRGG